MLTLWDFKCKVIFFGERLVGLRRKSTKQKGDIPEKEEWGHILGQKKTLQGKAPIKG